MGSVEKLATVLMIVPMADGAIFGEKQTTSGDCPKSFANKLKGIKMAAPKKRKWRDKEAGPEVLVENVNSQPKCKFPVNLRDWTGRRKWGQQGRVRHGERGSPLLPREEKSRNRG